MVNKQKRKKLNEIAVEASELAVSEGALERAPEAPDEELPEIDYNQPSSS